MKNTGKASAGEQAPTSAKGRPIQIRMGGYGPPTTGFSLALKRIGDRLKAKFGGDVEVKYVYNIMDLGYRAEDILWLVEDGVLTLGYQSSSYFTDRVPELGMADLPFIFDSNEKARAAMDGKLGKVLAGKIEERMNYRIAGYFENGFRQVSNRLRPVRVPADMKDMRIRVLPSKIQARTFELLGAKPLIMDLTEAIAGSQGRNPGRAGESVFQYGHLWRSQVPSLPHRDQPLLSLPADLHSPHARSTPGRTNCRPR